MAKKESMKDKIKDGVSVQEIEDFAKRYTNEVFAALAILVATISSLFDFFTGAGWSVIFAGAGAVVAIIFPDQISKGLGKMYAMIHKQEKPTQIILGIVKLVAAILVPFVLFALVGLLAGCSDYIHLKTKKK